MLMYLISFLCMFLAGLLSFSLKTQHILLMLLSIEFSIMSLYYLMFIFLIMAEDCSFSMVFLTMAVCEAALGLSLMVAIVRSHGNDYFRGFSVLW
uniref:NADH-ubiquinone oxidoreductase chain 4L n=1 Tax=Ptilodactylidae sp. 3 ACP-2013 TaxID=1434564 RepID=A0A3G3FX18_9COLE|nr:NADH dehydrogenase subunit 4L [Ptilodactylidae sp. 3 ACP-2013]